MEHPGSGFGTHEVGCSEHRHNNVALFCPNVPSLNCTKEYFDTTGSIHACISVRFATSIDTLPNTISQFPSFSLATEEWKREDLDMLFSRIAAILPKTDNIKFQTQAEKLDWVEVAFGEYTGQHCKDKWIDITTKVKLKCLLGDNY